MTTLNNEIINNLLTSTESVGYSGKLHYLVTYINSLRLKFHIFMQSPEPVFSVMFSSDNLASPVIILGRIDFSYEDTPALVIHKVGEAIKRINNGE